MNTTINKGEKEEEGVGGLMNFGLKLITPWELIAKALGEEITKNTVRHFLQTYGRLNTFSLPQPKRPTLAHQTLNHLMTLTYVRFTQ